MLRGVSLFVVGTLFGGLFLVSPHIRANGRNQAMDQEALVAEATQLSLVLSEIFGAVEKALRSGMTTQAIDDLVKNQIQRHRVESLFVGYNGYPAHVDTSINDEVVNNPPSERRLKEGDLLKAAGRHQGQEDIRNPGMDVCHRQGQ